MAEERKTNAAAEGSTGAGAAAGAGSASPAASGLLSLNVAGATLYELVAYPTRGEAEAVRLLMAYTATAYRAEEVSFKKAAKYKKTLKLGRLPVLFDDRTCTEIGTPLAMLRHIARASDCYGQTPEQCTKADTVAELVTAFNASFRAVACVRFIDTLALSKLFARGGLVHTFVTHLTVLINKSTNTFTGDAVTFADIMAFDALDLVQQVRPNILSRAPLLAKFFKTLSETPRLAAYLATRRASDFSDDGPHPLPTNHPVCVTGANGFIASHLVQQLLDRGYRVRGTARNITDEAKVGHLRTLPGADERLELFQADLLEDGAFAEAVSGCQVVYHTASPFFHSTKREDLIDPAVLGTKNVLASCKAAGVKRVVLTSSTAAIYLNRNPPGHLTTEADWTDIEYAEEKNSYYFIGKTLAEKAAWEIAETAPFKLVVMNPTLVIGPTIQPAMNTSTQIFLKLAHDDDNSNRCLVDVRDVALAHILGAEKHTAKGRYLLMTSSAPAKLYAKLFWKHVPAELAEAHTPAGTNTEPPVPVYFSCIKAQTELGIKFTPIERSIADTARCVVANGMLTAGDAEGEGKK